MGSPLARFLDRAAARAAALPPDAGFAWVAGHGLYGLARHPGLDPALRARIGEAARRNLAANLWLIHRFGEVAAALDGIAVCPLKGLHLLDTIYREHPEDRRLGDLDLLVRSDDVEAALARLRPLGLVELPRSRRAAAVSPERVVGDGRLLVELHGRLGIKHGPRSGWDDVAPAPAILHGRAVHLLDRETTLVHLVAHWVKHGPFVELRWAEDVLRWAEEGFDAAAAMATARRLGAERTLVAGARALRAAAGGEALPGIPATLPGAAGRAVGWNERRVWRLDPGDPFAVGERSTPARRNLSALLLADRPADAARFAAAKVRELSTR